MRPYNQGNDFPTLLAMLIAVAFPLLLLSLLFDLFPRDRVMTLLSDIRLPFSTTVAQPSPTTLPTVPTPPPLRLAAPDWDIANGHFFTQTNGQPALASAMGYAVTNDRGINFWSELRRLGGVETVGHPLSNRFLWRGFVVQVFEKLIFQAPESGGEISILNVMDDLSAAGKDEFLKNERFTPLPLGPEFDTGRSPEAIASARLELLKADAAIEKRYFDETDPLRRFGLPTSRVADLGDYVVALRTQRAVLQHWKKDGPWGKAGDITVANSGQLAIDAGLFPADALKPSVTSPPPRSAAFPSPSPSPASR